MDAIGGGQEIADWPFPKFWNRDAVLKSELDRLAAEFEMTPDECLMHFMRGRAEQEGTEAVRIMLDTATDLWRDFKPGSKRLKYWAASREARQAIRDGVPGDHFAYRRRI